MTVPRFLISIVLALLLALLVAAVLVPSSASALVATGDGSWVWESPTAGTAPLAGLDMATAKTAWVAGSWGRVLKTTDAGVAWAEVRETGTQDGYNHVAFVGARSGWAVGSVWDPVVGAPVAVVDRTTDGGAAWKRQYRGAQGGEMVAVTFLDATRGWALGRTDSRQFVLRTSDAGATWAIWSRAKIDRVTDIAFATSKRGWYSERWGDVLATADGGVHWTLKGTVPVVSGKVSAMVAAGSRTLYAVGLQRPAGPPPDPPGTHGAVWKTTDAGAHWTEQTIVAPGCLRDVRFVDALRGWAVGDGGAVFATSDGGAVWTAQTSGTTADLLAVDFVDALRGCVLGYDEDLAAGTATRFALWTTDGGATWARRDMPGVSLPEPEVLGAERPDLLHGWTVGSVRREYGVESAVVMGTSDGGATWMPRTVPGLSGEQRAATAVSFVGADHGWIGDSEGYLHATTDGGATWTGSRPTTVGAIRRLTFVDTLHGWAMYPDDSGFDALYATTDGGAGWARQATGHAGLGYADVAFCDADNGVLVHEGSVSTTTDGGATWSAHDLQPGDPNPASFAAAAMTDADHMWVGGDFGTVFGSTDGGTTWAEQTRGAAVEIVALRFVDSAHGWAVGESNDLLQTTDGGEHWLALRPGLGQGIATVAVPDVDHVSVFGERGAIVARDTSQPDTTPPTTTVSGLGTGWTNRTVTLAFVAIDNAGGWGMVGGPAVTEYSTDAGVTWTPGEQLVIVADTANHTTDGEYPLQVRSTDAAGNTGTVKSATLRIDTRRPVPKALSYTTTMRNTRTPLDYRISDARPNGGWATVTIKIKDLGGKLVKELSPGRKPVNKNQTAYFTCRLGRGVYKFYVYATDRAGNTQLKPGRDFLIVI